MTKEIMPNVGGLLYSPTNPFYGFAIAPCKLESDGNVEPCDPNEADFWGLYAIGEDLEHEWIADFETKDQAENFKNFLESVVLKHATIVYSATIESKHGPDILLSKDPDLLSDKVYNYVVEHSEEDLPEDHQEAIDTYFNQNFGDTISYSQGILI